MASTPIRDPRMRSSQRGKRGGRPAIGRGLRDGRRRREGLLTPPILTDTGERRAGERE